MLKLSVPFLFLFLQIILLNAFFTFGQNITCGSNNGNCGNCVSAGCGYCPSSQVCSAGTTGGPSDGVTVCAKGWQFGNCTDCSVYPDCRGCLTEEACLWCDSTGSTPGCQIIGNVTNVCDQELLCPCDDYPSCRQCTSDPACFYCSSNQACMDNSDIKSCSMATHSCPCSEYEGCHSCNNDFDCQWCDDEGGECQTVGTTCSFVAHTCPSQGPTNVPGAPPSRSFDGLSFFGGIVFGVGIIGCLGLVVYLVFRHRNRKYQPL